MMPRNLPGLAAAAIRGDWDVSIEHKTRPEIVAQFGHGMDFVRIVWNARTGRLVSAEINGEPTPYAQCAHLIRSTSWAS